MKAKYLLLLFFSFFIVLQTQLFAQNTKHPRIFFSEMDLDEIINRIGPKGEMHQDLINFLSDDYYISKTKVNKFDKPNFTNLHLILNKIMKNSFLFAIGKDSKINNSNTLFYYADRADYLNNIHDEIVYLLNDEVTNSIKNMGGRLAQGYVMKALSIAYDWGYRYYDNRQEYPQTIDLKTALVSWYNWLSNENKYYGSVFGNHGPWDSKGLAYVSVALGDESFFYGTATKVQRSMVPLKTTENLITNNENIVEGKVFVNAKPYFDQLLEAYNFVATSNGGWHESVAYLLVKALPEMIEYSELICNYHNNNDYTNTVYTGNFFKNVGEFLIQMTTADGLFQKIGDTGQKTSLPSEYFIGKASAYGDINDIGAAYISGYYLYCLYNRLMDAGEIEYALLAKYYADTFCFNFKFEQWKNEYKINYLYKLIWQDKILSKTTWKDISQFPSLQPFNYYQNSGIFVSHQQNFNDNDRTSVRFDTQAFYYSSHQHFSAGNFTIFKKGNLAIDGGRYIIPKSGREDQIFYKNRIYRAPISHNVLFFEKDDTLVGQDYLSEKANFNPYTLSQLPFYQNYAVGTKNIAITALDSEGLMVADPQPYVFRAIRASLSNVYKSADVDEYYRYLLHLTTSDQKYKELPEFVFIYDWVNLKDKNEKPAIWQMHFRDNGESREPSNNTFVISRNEIFKYTDFAGEDFGNQYKSNLFLKCLLPDVADFSIVDFPDPPHCENCWNGAVWEESNKILRIKSSESIHHEFIVCLLPSLNITNSEVNQRKIDKSITVSSSSNIQTVIVSGRMDGLFPNLDRSIVVNFINPEMSGSLKKIELTLNRQKLTEGIVSHYVFGLKPGWYEIAFSKNKVEWTTKKYYLTKSTYPTESWGTLVFNTTYSENENTGDKIKINYLE